MSLLPRNPVNRSGAGMVAGIATVAWMVPPGHSLAVFSPAHVWLADLNAGLIALLVTVTTMFAVSVSARRKVTKIAASPVAPLIYYHDERPL